MIPHNVLLLGLLLLGLGASAQPACAQFSPNNPYNNGGLYGGNLGNNYLLNPYNRSTQPLSPYLNMLHSTTRL